MATLPLAELPPPLGVSIRDFASISPKERPAVGDKVAKLERKIFPSSESFDYDIELKKKNIGVILAFKEFDSETLIAYLVYQRMKRIVWLHKLCVVESERQKGIGRCLIHALYRQMKSRGGESIQLWVDEHRKPARALYDSCGFQQVELRSDYYAAGRAGLKMQLSIVR
ncbi:acetyltransferas-like protein [Ophiobolus disseminans]|uniref:Acetyltransferas-like protein n=1 Tax=Ophiobolus disseminans TaxID=1469910 RepID=A0A6A7AM09_9PLEO|nr:acetyltransferas-like protein [Ophiobolus disseminans]